MAEQQRIVFLDWLRLIACFLVMTVHACECIYSNDYVFSFPSEADRWTISIIGAFVRTSVPLFLMASAYLLVPVKTDMMTFYKKRVNRVLIPFVIWLVLYTFLPGLLFGEWTFDQSLKNLSTVFINFIPRESHLWFMYMLLGIYLIMPVISPWLEKCSKKEEQIMLGIWMFTTLFYHFHEWFGSIFGECVWNPYPMFAYLSGFIGYVVLGHYIRYHIDWSPKKVYSICIPLFIACWVWCIYSFYTRSFRVDAVSSLELDWQFTSFAPVIMSFCAFMLIKQIRSTPAKLFSAVKSISAQTYGMYLMHMLFLPFYFSKIYPVMPVPFAVICTALATYITCYVLCLLISKVPYLRRMVG